MAPLETPQIKEWGEASRPRALEEIMLLDQALSEKEYLGGDAMTIADITGGVALDMLAWARIEMPAEASNVRRWHTALKARPSWRA
jgi:glutathione S-transferase